MNATKESVWGKNQLGIFSKGRTSSGCIGNECAFGVLNTASPQAIYLFRHPGHELYIAQNLQQLLGKHGVSHQTQVICNTSGKKLGFMSEVLAEYADMLASKEEIESQGFLVAFCQDAGHWEASLDPDLEPDCDTHALEGTESRNLTDFISAARTRLSLHRLAAN